MVRARQSTDRHPANQTDRERQPVNQKDRERDSHIERQPESQRTRETDTLVVCEQGSHRQSRSPQHTMWHRESGRLGEMQRDPHARQSSVTSQAAFLLKKGRKEKGNTIIRMSAVTRMPVGCRTENMLVYVSIPQQVRLPS